MKNKQQTKMRKSQSAIEFVILASFMLLVILGFFALTSSRVLEAKEEGNKKIAENIADLVYREIETAKSVNNGYIRVFTVPKTVNGAAYTINLTDNRELIVTYLGYEYIRFVPSNVSGNLSVGSVEIKKLDDVIYLRGISECNDKIDNDGDGLIDMLDPGCSDPADNDESNCGDSVCTGNENCARCIIDCGQCPVTEFEVKNSLSTVIRFYGDGNVILKGTLQQNTIPQATSDDEFIIRDSNGNNVAVINMATGNMFIKGTLQENQLTLNPSPTSSNFIVKNSDGIVVAYIDELGNFLLKGHLTQNGNP